MNFTPTAIPDVILVEPKVFGDSRGFLLETYQAKKFAEAGIAAEFVQDNHSGSGQGTLRGLHYQIEHAQGKLVRVLVGEIFDAAVDLRRSSSTFGQWVGYYLSAENKQQLWIPPGLAHGFYVTSPWAEIQYKATDFYAPESERTLLWNDAKIGIQWPLLDGREPLLSEKDKCARSWKEAEFYA